MMMFRNITFKILVTAAVCSLAFNSCDIGDDVRVCNYNLQLNYHYNQENTTSENMLEQYVSSITEYIFDAGGVLYAVNDVPVDPCGDKFLSQQTLPAGRYSVISWGNLDMSHNGAVNDARPGVTRREDMLLYDTPHYIDGEFQGSDTRLYYGYRTFTINRYGISRVRVDMVHSHLDLKFVVRWKNNVPGVLSGFRMQLTGIPEQYGFMPEYISRGTDPCSPFTAADDDYPKTSDGVIHYIPLVYQDVNVFNHMEYTSMDADKALRGEFITFRIRNATDVKMRLFAADQPLMPELSLKDYFADQGIDLDKTLKQEYTIVLEIDGDDMTVYPGDAGDLDPGNGPGDNDQGDAGDLNEGDSDGDADGDAGDLNDGGTGGGNAGDAGDLNSKDLGPESGGNSGDLTPGGDLEELP